MYDFEKQSYDKLRVDVVACIYLYTEDNNGNPQILCAFLEDEDGNLTLPYIQANKREYLAETAIRLFKKSLKVNLRTLDIVPGGFFDPISFFDPIYSNLTDEEKANRTIIVAYKTVITPGTPVNNALRFMNHDEVEVARKRIARGHHKAYKEGIS